MQKSLRCKDFRLGFGILILFGISLARKSAAEKPEFWHCFWVCFSGIFNEPLSLRVKQGVVTTVGVFVDFAVSYACKAPGTGQSLAETTDAGEHIHKLDQGHNSLWGCLPDLRMCLIGAPHQKQKQLVTGRTEQDFFTVHYVSTSSYYKVVVIKVPLQGQNATIDKVLWIGLNLLPQDGFGKAPTTALCF